MREVRGKKGKRVSLRRAVIALPAAAVLSTTMMMLLVPACASMYSADEAMEEIAWDVAAQVQEKPGIYSGRTLAVYYFTEDGEMSGLSDFLIDTLTSQLAYVVSDEKLDIRIVSRQALDRILEETEFQLSAMADEESQVEIGRQLGADVILTGTVTPIYEDEDYRINAQLIDVQTGEVLYGFIYEFWT